MTKNMGLVLLIMGLQVGLSLPAFSQSNQPIGSSNAVGSVSNSNANSNTFSSSGTSSSSSSSSSSGTVILLPNGTRASPSISTITVCDDVAHSFPNEIDLCSLK